MPQDEWKRNPDMTWSYYDRLGQKVEGFNPLTDLIGKGWGAAKSFVEWSDPKLSRFESSVANILGEGIDKVNEARQRIKEREDAITEPIMKSIGDRLAWHPDAMTKYGEYLTYHQFNQREEEKTYARIIELDQKHRGAEFGRQHQKAVDFFTKQNTEVE
tara:strand:+ start:41 stop:517 length:477 start_codon:yes stop_codon:yes gene_type:complete